MDPRTLLISLVLCCGLMSCGPSLKFAGTVSPAVKSNGYTFENSLGMRFVPVTITGAHGDEKNSRSILFCIHVTRKMDYRKYAEANAHVDPSWTKVAFHGELVSSGEDHPVVMVSWEDAKAFCAWLSAKEHRRYRLPTDHEWSCAVGIGYLDNMDEIPFEKGAAYPGLYAWGTAWPPPKGAGNFADEAFERRFPTSWKIVGYEDGFATTSPVTSFDPNPLGLYDMAGNVYQWCQDWYDAEHKYRTIRGGAWDEDSSDDELHAASSFGLLPTGREDDTGFRIVLEMDEKGHGS
jgi:formylglycine-generating enzyme required for sulfatase activity